MVSNELRKKIKTLPLSQKGYFSFSSISEPELKGSVKAINTSERSKSPTENSTFWNWEKVLLNCPADFYVEHTKNF